MKEKIKKYLQNLIIMRKYFGFSFMINCLIRRILSFKLYEKYIYKYLNCYFSDFIKTYKKNSFKNADNDNQNTFHIWTLWWQGEDKAPEIVKICLESQKKYLLHLGIEYHIVTKENWNDFIDLPNYIIDKVDKGIISFTHFSDILRAELIRKYGGVWIDATVLCVKPFDLREKSNPFFTLKTFNSSEYITLRRWTGFFIGDEKKSILFDFLAEAFRYYWEKENSLIVYLLIDYLIAIAYDNFPQVKNKIDCCSISNINLWELLNNLNEEYKQENWNRITKDTCFFKLSYKSEFNGGPLLEMTDAESLTNYGFIKSKIMVGQDEKN